MEETRRIDDIPHRLHDLLLGSVQLKQCRQHEPVINVVAGGLAGVVLVAHLHTFGKDRLDGDAAQLVERLHHGREQLLAHIAQVLRDLLGVKAPAAEAALKRSFRRERRGDGMVVPVLHNVQDDGLRNDARARADRVVVECAGDFDLACLEALDRFFLVLRPALKEHCADHAALVEHRHVLIGDWGARVEDHVILQPIDAFDGRLHIHPDGVAVHEHMDCFLICLRYFFFYIHLCRVSFCVQSSLSRSARISGFSLTGGRHSSCVTLTPCFSTAS